ncbi:Tetratricopeptide repeat protein 1 [Tolypocladium paradoxum]|uniref:Tetratricopeptide repeat protein 1 n=1 Tax=Tolypocladium paradoxum TaxID=94208 RepID=A0A2S4KX21_9HYPO|nr:Tetratricopeptide repeat protein 1 [Tolypocladium paradoxum]
MGPSVEAKDKSPDAADEPDVPRFTPEEEAALLRESHSIKAEANALFSSQDYDGALARYDDAAASCPEHLDYERAVIRSNIAACHLKLEQWKEAIKAATQALDGLAALEKQAPESAPAPPSQPPPARADVLRIRTKALLRRARARSEAGGWQNLAGAEEDYRALAGMPGLGPADARTVRAQLQALPPRTKAAQEAEMGEMWGKLRHLGDGILKPFGLSTQNFQMVKDEKSGGYSMNFTQGGGSSS